MTNEPDDWKHGGGPAGTLEIPGGQQPNGNVRTSGAKNSATRLMAAALLTSEHVRLDNFPTELIDARVKADFLTRVGADVRFASDTQSLTIQAREVTTAPIERYDHPIRTTYLLAAGQLMRNGIARIPYPGGCRIGSRKHDLHIMTWEKFGCRVFERPEFIEIDCPRLNQAEITFPFATVGGTENALLCGAVASGTSIIRNGYVTPEVEDLVDLLRSMGASIEVTGHSRIEIHGRPELRGAEHRVIPDRIEALTWIIYGALSGGRLRVEGVPFSALQVPLIHLRHAGIDLVTDDDSVDIHREATHHGEIQPFELACGTHPGVISDMQPFFVLLALGAAGASRVVDYRYPERIAYLSQLAKLSQGGIEWTPGDIHIHGRASFRGADVQATDLRGCMALILAGLLAQGTTRVHNVEMALRGYDRLLTKLQGLGLRVRLQSIRQDAHSGV